MIGEWLKGGSFLLVGLSASLALSSCATPALPAASPGTGRVVMIPPPGKEDHAPGIDISLRNRQPPHYPLAAIAAHHQGTVVLDVAIDETGQVRGVTVERSSGYPEIDQAAIDAAKGWRYNPGMRNGIPVGGVVRTPVNFSLAPSSSPHA